MGTLVATTPWSFAKGATTQTVAIPAAAAGSTLVLVANGGAQVTAKITSSSGASFTQRTQALGTLAVSIADYVTSGGETAVVLTLNAAENVAGIIYEAAGLGAFIGASNNGTGAQAVTANDFQSKPSSAVTVTAGAAMLFGAWAVSATFASNPFNGVNSWRCMGPLGHLYQNAALQPGANTQFCYASGVADVTSAASYPAQLSAGQYEATSVWVQGGSASTFAAQAAYADASGVATNPAVNPIVGENSLPGTSQANWFLGSAGTDSTIAGFTDKPGYLPGDTVNFKVDSTSNPFRVEIYRLGYYGWETFAARNVLGNQAGYITGTVTSQPAASVDATLGSASCAWAVNATWAIPAGAAPGLYYVLYRRTDITSHLAGGHFIVRPASAQGLAAVCLPDFTYQAYNCWGATTDNGTFGVGTWTGRSLYQAGADAASPSLAHRAYAVSFDRPYGTQVTQANTYFFDAEQGIICFLEAQGYNLGYYSNKDLDDNTTLLNKAAAVLMIGHHEYWTQGVYDCFLAARDAGVNMMIDSSNTALWRVRFAAGDVNKRTVICYKDSTSVDVSAGWSGTGRDPGGYTGTWRDSRSGSAPNNPLVRRENALTGQIFVNSAHQSVALTVPFASKAQPAWRNSPSVQALTSGQAYTTPTGAGGDELDSADGSSGQPANLVALCPTTTTNLSAGANAVGDTYSATTSPVIGFTLYRAASGALVMNTGSWRGWQGTSRWAQNRIGGTVTASDVNWQNALLAVLYDLGLVPVAAREMRPATDTALVNPGSGAPAGWPNRNAVAAAYGLAVPTPSLMAGMTA